MVKREFKQSKKVLSQEFLDMLEFYLSDKFKMTKKNLTLFFNALHKIDYNMVFEKDLVVRFFTKNEPMYKEMEELGSALFDWDYFKPKEQYINILLYNYKNNLMNKWNILLMYIHETVHEKQFDNIYIKLKKNISDYEHLIKYSFMFGQELYHFEIIELEAIMGEINKMVSILKANKKLINKYSIYRLIEILKDLSNELNFLENEKIYKEIYQKYGKELKNRGVSFREYSLSAKPAIELHSIVYDNKFWFLRNNRFITISDEQYKNKLIQILDKKISSCYIKAFNFVYENALKLYNPKNKTEQEKRFCLSKKDFTALLNATDILDKNEILYFGLVNKFEKIKNDENTQENVENKTL